MMSDGDGAGAGAEVASPKVNPPSSGQKQSKASRIAAALQGALAHVSGKLPAVLRKVLMLCLCLSHLLCWFAWND